ncbi:MAG TPA: hypothetical protein VHW24_27830 [Bryobacteraceae bacterium]|nr:hypothetical protein [Bryobacteraceae bacterium]
MWSQGARQTCGRGRGSWAEGRKLGKVVWDLGGHGGDEFECEDRLSGGRPQAGAKVVWDLSGHGGDEFEREDRGSWAEGRKLGRR